MLSSFFSIVCFLFTGFVLLVSCDNFSFGEGIHNFGIKKNEFDGHTYIIYRSEKGVAMLKDPECAKCWDLE